MDGGMWRMYFPHFLRKSVQDREMKFLSAGGGTEVWGCARDARKEGQRHHLPCSVPSLLAAGISLTERMAHEERKSRCLFVCGSYGVTDPSIGTLRVLMGALIVTEVIVVRGIAVMREQGFVSSAFFARHHLQESFIYKSFNFKTVPWGRYGYCLCFITDLNGSAGWWVVIHPGILPGRPGVTCERALSSLGFCFQRDRRQTEYSSLSAKNIWPTICSLSGGSDSLSELGSE